MKKSVSIRSKEFNEKRLVDIFNYVISLSMLETNPNMRSIALRNPIRIMSTYDILKNLKKEIDDVEIDIADINIENIFESNREGNEIENFIRNFNNHSCLSSNINLYNTIKANEEIEAIYPYNERLKRRQFLELEIDKMLQTNAKLAKISPALARDREIEIRELSKELNKLVESLDVPTKEELTLRCYSSAMHNISYLKNMIDEKVDYLSRLVEEMK